MSCVSLGHFLNGPRRLDFSGHLACLDFVWSGCVAMTSWSCVSHHQLYDFRYWIPLGIRLTFSNSPWYAIFINWIPPVYDLRFRIDFRYWIPLGIRFPILNSPWSTISDIEFPLVYDFRYWIAFDASEASRLTDWSHRGHRSIILVVGKKRLSVWLRAKRANMWDKWQRIDCFHECSITLKLSRMQ